MSLQMVYGRAGTGKTAYCLQEIKNNIDVADKIYMITPEQFSYMQEKRLLESLNANAVFNAEVITFNRMLDRIKSEVGGIDKKELTKSSKAMLLFSIMQKNKDRFTYLGKSKENIDLALRTLTEFKKHNVTIDKLESNLEQVEDASLKLKIEDMLTIYKNYEEQKNDNYIDDDDRLTILSKLLEKSQMFDDSLVFVDEFAGFTAQEYEILKQIFLKAKKVTITSCIDFEDDLFNVNKQVVDKVLSLAKDIKIEEPIELKNAYRFKNDELKHLEQNIYKNRYEKYEKIPKNIHLFLASNPYTEIEYVSKKILELVRNKGYSFKDIAVITKDIDTISSILKAVFKKYEIPYFMDDKDQLEQSIAIKYILSILEIFSKNWSYESVLNYIKLGFTSLEKEDICEIENYAKKWGIRGSKWYKEDFQNGDNLDYLNEKRRIIVTPLLDFKEKLQGVKTVEKISKEIFMFLKENNFYEILNKKISFLEEEGELKLADEYKQSIESLTQLLDEIVENFKDEKITIEKYVEILKAGLRYIKLGSIPQNLDQVTIGDVDRSRTNNVKACFIIGVNDGAFPSINKDEGFFNDSDRNILKELGTELAKDTTQMLYDEEFNIYKALTTAEEKLFISYTSQGIDGEAKRGSVIISKLKKIFPKIIEESDVTKKFTDVTSIQSTFDELLYNIRDYLDGVKIQDEWFDVYNWYNQNEKWRPKLEEALKGMTHKNLADKINEDNIKKLYGKTLKTSISKLERYQECPFSFHLKYGLNLKEAEEFKIKSIDTGTFMHDIVDTFFEEIKEEDLKSLTKEDVKEIVNKIIEEKLELKKNAIFLSSAKFIVLTNRLKKVIAESTYYIVYQMQNSSFKILGNEVEFSEHIDNVEIVGKIDRLDTAENEDGKYIRIIDYKSSNKTLDLNKMVAGLQIQLLTYIDAMAQKTNKEPARNAIF